MKFTLAVFTTLTVFIISCGPSVSQDEQIEEKTSLKNYDRPLSALISKNLPIEIHIDKSEFWLRVMHADTVVKEYPVVLGTNPSDDKRYEGDRCTPEGTFYIRAKYPHNSWNKFMWVDYPTKESWAKFNQAKKDGEIEKDATVGSEIGIHGVPEGMDFMIDERENWTWGCISLKNKDLDDLYPYIAVKKTKIVITP